MQRQESCATNPHEQLSATHVTVEVLIRLGIAGESCRSWKASLSERACFSTSQTGR